MRGDESSSSPTDTAGGTDGASSSALASCAEIGRIRSDFGAGGVQSEEAKKVAVTVAVGVEM